MMLSKATRFLNTRKYIFIGMFAITTVMQFNSCVYEVETPNTCFQEDVQAIFVSKCNYSGCHNGNDKKAGIDLSNYEGVMKVITAGKPMQSEAYTQVKFNQMPPSGFDKLDRLEMTTIKNWIKAGAPNSSNCVTCDTTFRYGARIQPILNKWCVTCHQPGNLGGNFDLSNYTGVKNSITQGRLIGSVKHSSGFSAMPQNASPLSACDIDAISNWVDAGYPEN